MQRTGLHPQPFRSCGLTYVRGHSRKAEDFPELCCLVLREILLRNDIEIRADKIDQKVFRIFVDLHAVSEADLRRRDRFILGRFLRKKLLKDADGRFLIWLPTFRAQEVGRTDADDGRYAALGIPLFYDRESLMAFDRYLKDRGLYVVYKPHPVQDVRGLVSEKLTNLILITDETLRRADLQLYEVIAASEALITDYSSVFFDYLLLDRPIATTTDDIESWKEGRGFAFDLESMYNKATCRVPDQEALYAFTEGVIKGEDPYAEGRREVRDLTNLHQDGKSAERVADFVIGKLTRKQ